jgi:hypothetical protein
MWLAVTAVDTFKPGLDLRFAVGGDVEATLKRDWVSLRAPRGLKCRFSFFIGIGCWIRSGIFGLPLIAMCSCLLK